MSKKVKIELVQCKCHERIKQKALPKVFAHEKSNEIRRDLISIPNSDPTWQLCSSMWILLVMDAGPDGKYIETSGV